LLRQITHAAIAPKSDKRTSEITVIRADDPNELQKRKLGSFITAFMFSRSCEKLAPAKLTGLEVMSAVTFPELIRSRKNGNNT